MRISFPFVLVLMFVAACRGGSTGETKESPRAAVVAKEEAKMGKNHLQGEKSPYLLQHVDNPVEWYPWGDEAFEKAQKENKPVFLSIGYATCHWCHVMAHESFEDDEVAKLLNDDFVSIKVDREERPDIDSIYMNVAQMMTGSGGWPLTIVMTPYKEPFFAATYIPKESRFGRIGMMELVPRIVQKWTSERDEVVGQARQITGALQRLSDADKGESPGTEALELGFNQLARRYDGENGGFGNQMKFPTPHNLLFLLRYYHRTGNAGGLEMVETTLKKMRYGGVYDHLGYGFHRYSTDPEWLVPHFEKMLYDQALLLWAYAEAWAITGDPFYATVAREIVTYVERDLTDKAGGFYSAEDADSEGVEGKFYLWSHSEMAQHLSDEEAALWTKRFGIKEGGNFEAHETPPNTNILHYPGGKNDVFAGDEAKQAVLEGIRKNLLGVREKRIRPLLDDKILTDWNGLMIGALAFAGRTMGEPSFVALAQKAASFVLTELVDGNGDLLHRYREGESGIAGQLDDYAFMGFACTELYLATHDPAYLERAVGLASEAQDRFLDPRDGSYYMSPLSTDDLPVRPKEYYDGAIPSGNAMMLYNLVRLSRLTGDASLEERGDKLAGTWASQVKRSAASFTLFLVGLEFALGPSAELVVVSSPDEATPLLEVLEGYTPRVVSVLKTPGTEKLLSRLAPYTKDQVAIGGKPTGYVCVNNACSFPTSDPKTLKQNLQKILSTN